MNTNANSHNYQCIYFLSMFLTIMGIVHTILINKLVTTPLGIMSVATLVSPAFVILSDVITEVYGPRLSSQIQQLSWLTQFVIGLLCLFFINLPSPNFLQLKSHFEYVIGNISYMIIFSATAALISIYINTNLLSKWKILLRGKYFWLRSIGSSGLALAIFTLLITPVFISIGITHDTKTLISIMSWGFFFKIFCLVIFAFPSTLLVILLKKIEKIDINADQSTFNPFKQTN